MIFQNRKQAGEKLAQELKKLHLIDPVVLALPRGGVPVGAAVARALACALDVIPLIKIPIPWSPDASYGVVVMDGTFALNKPLIHRLELSEREIEMAATIVIQEVKRREKLYRGDKPFPPLDTRTVILTDDGLASGYSMLAAAAFVKKRSPLAVVAAAPVASDVARKMLAAAASINRLVTLSVDAEQLFSLSSHYKEFKPVSDDDVISLLSAAKPG
jgi:predicted phosphoribosyltransferase